MVKLRLNSGDEYLINESIEEVKKALNENTKKYVAFHQEHSDFVRWFYADAIISFIEYIKVDYGFDFE